MPKKLRRVVYGGPAEELTLDMRGKKVVIPKGVAAVVDEDTFQHLMDGQKKYNVLAVDSVEDSRMSKLKNRLIKEEA